MAIALKFLFKLIVLVILLLPFAAVGVFLLSLQETPSIAKGSPLFQKDIDRARKLLSSTREQFSNDSSIKIIRFTDQDLNLLSRYLLTTISYKHIYHAQQVDIQPNKLTQQISIGIQQPASVFLNLSLSLSKQHDRLTITDVQIGQFRIPDQLSELVLAFSQYLFGKTEFSGALEQSLVDYQIEKNALQLYLRKLSATEQQARKKLRSFIENEAAIAYASQTASLMKSPGMSLDRLLASLFTFANQRSATDSAIEENRALLLMLGNWALGKQHFENIRLPTFNLRLNKRKDLARHMLISAAISSNSSSLLSNMIGTGKEIQDSMGGSGFSFDDLAADRLGTYLGDRATRNNNMALDTQKRFSDQTLNSEIHKIANHPIAPMTNKEFTDRFGSVDDPRYKKQLEFIDLQIHSSPLFRP